MSSPAPRSDDPPPGPAGADDAWPWVDGVPVAGDLTVDLDAIAANVATLRRAATGSDVMAVVKADAYGHGLVPSARAALAGGAGWLGVAQPVEALALRRAGITAPVLCWLYPPGSVGPLVAAGVDVSAAAPWTIDEAETAARATGEPARVHLKIDTGLGRGGAPSAAWDQLCARTGAAVRRGTIELIGVWSHLAFADAPHHPTVKEQREVVLDAVGVAHRAGLRPQVRHLANSAATLTSPDTHFDLVRPGLAVYGLSPVPEVASAAELGLRPAMGLTSRLALVKDVPAGQGVSYGHAYTTSVATTLGLVPLGYADGVPRHASGAGPVTVRAGGDHVPLATTVAGRVCMDQIVVDLGPGGSGRFAAGVGVVPRGDPARAEPPAPAWADAAGTISYEIVTRMSSRLPRR
ncbi:MAG: alanine racemase, partial [Acidimicrobiales bacterium]